MKVLLVDDYFLILVVLCVVIEGLGEFIRVIVVESVVVVCEVLVFMGDFELVLFDL